MTQGRSLRLFLVDGRSNWSMLPHQYKHKINDKN